MSGPQLWVQNQSNMKMGCLFSKWNEDGWTCISVCTQVQLVAENTHGIDRAVSVEFLGGKFVAQTSFHVINRAESSVHIAVCCISAKQAVRVPIHQYLFKRGKEELHINCESA